MRVAPPIVLSPEERVTLLRWARRNPRRDVRALRARIVLIAAEGDRNIDIGHRLGVGRLTAARWRGRFLAHRIQGIEQSLARLPRKGRIPEQRIREILRAMTGAPGVLHARVSTRSLARQFGLSHSTVRRLWIETGIRPTRIAATPFRPDPVRPLVPHDVAGVYLHPPDYAIAFTLGRPTESLPGLTRVREGTGHSGGAAAGLSFPAHRAARLSFPRTSVVPSPLRSSGFLRFLVELESSTGKGRPIRIVATGPGLADAPELRPWSVRRPHVWLDWTEDLDSWVHRVEGDLARVGPVAAPRRGATGRRETSRAIGLFLTSYAGSTAPFQWIASPQEIAADDAAGRLRYDLSVTGHPGFKKPPGVLASMRSSPSVDPRAREMARVVLRKSLGVRRGEHVAIESWSETLDYADAFVLEALRLGARPLLFYQDEPTYWAAVASSRPSDLARIGDHLRAAIAKSDALITFFGPSDRERFHALPAATRFRLSEYRDALYEAAAKAGTRAVQLALGRASAGSARMYGVDLAVWRTELVEGTSVDPGVLHRRAGRIARVLRTGRSIEISHPNGTRLRLGLRGRRPQVSDGLVPPARPGGDWNLVQLPAGVVSVALDERVAEGLLVSNVPNSVGVFDTVGEVVGGRWIFTHGRLSRFQYDRGGELFAESYARGGIGKDRPGLLSVGLNDRISIAPLLLDQGEGTLTLQIGRNDTAGGTNHVGWWAWLLLHGADLKVDGRTLVKAGKLVK